MEKFSEPLAEDFAGRMQGFVGQDYPMRREYEEAFKRVGLSFESLKSLISKITQNPKIKEIVPRVFDGVALRRIIVPMIDEELRELDPKLRKIILDQPGLLSIIADQVIFSIDEEFQAEEKTEYFYHTEKNFNYEFPVMEIVSEICRVEGLEPGELELVSIQKDKNNKTFNLLFQLVGQKTLKNLQQNITYSFLYPYKSSDPNDQEVPDYPVVTKFVFEKKDEKMTGEDDEDDEEYETVSDDLILVFQNGHWRNAKSSRGI